MKKLKEMNINPSGFPGSGGKHTSSRLVEDQKKMMLALGKDLNRDNFPGFGLLPLEASLPLNDDSINFSNLESSINPSQYNESTKN